MILREIGTEGSAKGAVRDGSDDQGLAVESEHNGTSQPRGFLRRLHLHG